MLLIEKNLKVILAHPKLFVIHVFSQLAPTTLVSGEHFILKDLPFYKVARFANAEAR